ncbi:MAG: hypothetical protein ACKO01_13425 [Erythrobacter sp.]
MAEWLEMLRRCHLTAGITCNFFPVAKIVAFNKISHSCKLVASSAYSQTQSLRRSAASSARKRPTGTALNRGAKPVHTPVEKLRKSDGRLAPAIHSNPGAEIRTKTGWLAVLLRRETLYLPDIWI